MTTRLRLWTVLVIGLVLAAPVNAGNFELLHYDEATIADIHAAFKAKTLTCRALVQMYLDRIEAYDRKGPALNAIVVTNPDALKVADALDAKFAQSGPVGPLHCVPLIVKDNYETTDMPTSAGSLSLEGRDVEDGRASRSRSSARPAPSCWPRATWRSSPSIRWRR